MHRRAISPCSLRARALLSLVVLAAPALAPATVRAQAPHTLPAEHGASHRDHGAHDPGAHAPGTHAHDLGPAGATYDLRFIDGMVQHHTGALRMGEFVFDIGAPGVGALAKTIWREQAQEIKAMGQWRKAWYPEAPVYSVVLPPGGDPDSIAALARMSGAEIDAMRMITTLPSRDTRVIWFLEGMLHHHGGALVMAHDALKKSTNPALRRFSRAVIRAQRAEIIELRRMLALEGLRKPEYAAYDALFAL